MQKFIACLLLGALLGMIPPLLPAQQNQSMQKSDLEIEALKKRVSELEKQLQAVENVEKMDLQTKLAEANTKLANVEFGKFRRELRDSNDEWLKRWSSWFVGVIGFFVLVIGGVGAVFWFWLRSRADQLITDEVEKSIDRFKEIVGQVEMMKNELRELKTEHAASMLKSIIHSYFKDENSYPEHIKALPEELLLQVFDDERYDIEVRYRAAEALSHRKSPRLVSPLLEFLNSAIHSERNWTEERRGQRAFNPCIFVGFLEKIRTPEVYQGLAKFLNRLLTENPRHKDLFLEETVFSIMWIGAHLNMGDAVPVLARAVIDLADLEDRLESLDFLVTHFDRFNEPKGIKEILEWHVANETSDVEDLEDRCLELLESYDPEFVEEWKARKATHKEHS